MITVKWYNHFELKIVNFYFANFSQISLRKVWEGWGQAWRLLHAGSGQTFSLQSLSGWLLALWPDSPIFDWKDWAAIFSQKNCPNFWWLFWKMTQSLTTNGCGYLLGSFGKTLSYFLFNYLFTLAYQVMWTKNICFIVLYDYILHPWPPNKSIALLILFFIQQLPIPSKPFREILILYLAYLANLLERY